LLGRLTWPFLIVFLIAAVTIFLVGAVESVGYNGTTDLQSLSASSPKWSDFQQKFSEQNLLESTKPFFWADNGRPKIVQGSVQFDSRLVDSLNYLASSKQTTCGINRAHDAIALSVIGQTQDQTSDLSFDPSNSPSTSTLYRGVGIRLLGLDQIKCTIRPITQYCSYKQPSVFDSLVIFFSKSANITGDKPYDSANCAVTCAVDYYPQAPVDATNGDITAPQVPTELSKFNPGEFDYSQIGDKAPQAATYKMAQVMWELMKIDDPGCAKPAGLRGTDRLIPLTLISSAFEQTQLGDFWPSLMKIANAEFPYNFQKQSPLAGLSLDPLLDSEGIHFNY
jgi:hypothetical protein